MKKTTKPILILLFLLSVATVSAVTVGFPIGPGFAKPLLADTNGNVKLLEPSKEKLKSNIEPDINFENYAEELSVQKYKGQIFLRFP